MKRLFFFILLGLIFPSLALAGLEDCQSQAAAAVAYGCTGPSEFNAVNFYVVYQGHAYTTAEADSILGGHSGGFTYWDDPDDNDWDVKVYFKRTNIAIGGIGTGNCEMYLDCPPDTQCQNVQCVTYVVISQCEPHEDMYCIIDTYACPNGQGIGFGYTRCQDDVPQDEYQFCGNLDVAMLLHDGLIDGTINYPACNCGRTLSEIQQYCAALGAGSDCDIDWDCEGDEDCDGVPDEDDLCENTPYGVQVDQWGCEIEGDMDTDTDGDGVPDYEDLEPDTPEGNIVDANGVTIINPQPDPNPDGGDQDNDNALLEAIISWLKKISNINSDIKENTEDIKEGIDDLNDSNKPDPNYSDDPDAIEKDEDGMTDSIDNMLESYENSAVSNFLKNTTSNFSGSSSLCIDIADQTVCTDFSRWQDIFNTLGNLLVMIVTFLSGLYVFRG